MQIIKIIIEKSSPSSVVRRPSSSVVRRRCCCCSKSSQSQQRGPAAMRRNPRARREEGRGSEGKRKPNEQLRARSKRQPSTGTNPCKGATVESTATPNVATPAGNKSKSRGRIPRAGDRAKAKARVNSCSTSSITNPKPQ